MKKLSNIKIYLFILAVLLPSSVSASTMYIDSNHSNFHVGDTILFSVYIDPENENINVVEGEILLDYLEGAISLIDINIPGSEFSLWPVRPFPADDNKSIPFVGGSTKGLTSKEAILFNIVLKLHEEGEITLSPDSIGVYLNDGEGTRDEVRLKDLVINVLPQQPGREPINDWGDILAFDKTPPEPFEIDYGRDPSIFDNQFFISFFTTDSESGVAYYEVKEGRKDYVRASSPYLLQDQSLRNLIKVKAVDKAGNERIAEVMPEAPPDVVVPFYENNLFWIIVIAIIVLLIVYALWRVIRRKK